MTVKLRGVSRNVDGSLKVVSIAASVSLTVTLSLNGMGVNVKFKFCVPGSMTKGCSA